MPRISGKETIDLERKMVKIRTPVEALKYAMMWMIPDKTERQRVMDELSSNL